MTPCKGTVIHTSQCPQFRNRIGILPPQLRQQPPRCRLAVRGRTPCCDSLPTLWCYPGTGLDVLDAVVGALHETRLLVLLGIRSLVGVADERMCAWLEMSNVRQLELGALSESSTRELIAGNARGARLLTPREEGGLLLLSIPTEGKSA